MKSFNRGVIITLTLLLTLTLINCQKEDDSSLTPDSQQENNQDANIISKTVSGADIPDIIAFVESKSSPSLTFKFGEPNYAPAPGGGGSTVNHEDNLTITQAMTDEIVSITQYSKTNYAFDMPTNDPDYFLNLIVVEHTDGDYMYFVKYVPNTGIFWDGVNMETFEGVKYLYSDTGVYRTKTYHSNGTMGMVPCPCPDDDGTGGGTGGGGGSCTMESWVICNRYNEPHQNYSECRCHILNNCTGYTTEVIVTCTTSAGPQIQGSHINDSPDTCYCWEEDGGSGTGGEGSGGGVDTTPDCPGVAPCTHELQSFDENCECAYNANPIEPINNAEYTAARIAIKDCIGVYGANYLDNNPSDVWAISKYLDDNGCSSANENFLKKAIDASEEAGEVDFDEKRINGITLDSSLPDCLENIILDLMLGNAPYSASMGNIELIEDTFSTLSDANSANPIGINVIYKTGNITGNGRTQGLGYNSATQTIDIEITISNNLVSNGTKLAVIKTVLHESIHAYLMKIKHEYPAYFSTSSEFSQLILGYKNYKDDNDPEHIYMAGLITNMANNLSNFAQEKYGYPVSTIDYYEAVGWSGITHLTDGTLNPLFSNNYPNFNDQQNIIKIFNTENGTASYTGYSPLINNNCN